MNFSNRLYTVHVITNLASYRDRTVTLPSGTTNISFELTFNDHKAISSLLHALAFEEKMPQWKPGSEFKLIREKTKLK